VEEVGRVGDPETLFGGVAQKLHRRRERVKGSPSPGPQKGDGDDLGPSKFVRDRVPKTIPIPGSILCLLIEDVMDKLIDIRTDDRLNVNF